MNIVKILKITLLFLFMSFLCTFYVKSINAITTRQKAPAEKIAKIREESTYADYVYIDKEKRLRVYGELVKDSRELAEKYPHDSNPLLWEAVNYAAPSRLLGKLEALSNLKKAKELLLMAERIDPNIQEGGIYNVLGILHYKAPHWPLSYGSKKKSEVYFKKALIISSNLDNHFRYGEFLYYCGRNEESLSHLKKSLTFPDRKRPEDAAKIQEIKRVIKEVGKDLNAGKK